MLTRRSALTGVIASSVLLRSELSIAQASSAPISLALNENPFGPSPRALQAIQNELAALSRYNSEAATNQLIDAIAKQERVDREHIVLGEILEPLGLHLAIEGGRGSEFVYSVPGYPALVDAASTVGGKAITVPLDAELRNDLPTLAARVNERTRAVFIVNPHNPSGTVNDNASFKRFLRETAQRTLVIVDEAYLEFTDEFATRTAVDLTRDGANVVVFRTFAKAYGLGGLDIGYGIVPKPFAKLLRDRGVGAPRSLNRLAVAGATAAVQDQSFVNEVRKKVRVERGLWHDLFATLRLRHSQAHGNFVFFDAKRPQAEVRAALLKQSIEIGRAFPPYDTWARISIGLPAENARARDALRTSFAP